MAERIVNGIENQKGLMIWKTDLSVPMMWHGNLSVSKPYAYKLIRQAERGIESTGFYYDCRACKPPVFL